MFQYIHLSEKCSNLHLLHNQLFVSSRYFYSCNISSHWPAAEEELRKKNTNTHHLYEGSSKNLHTFYHFIKISFLISLKLNLILYFYKYIYLIQKSPKSKQCTKLNFLNCRRKEITCRHTEQ